jgi:hypothetical protein
VIVQVYCSIKRMLYSERDSGLVCFSKDRTNKRLNQVIVYIIPHKVSF